MKYRFKIAKHMLEFNHNVKFRAEKIISDVRAKYKFPGPARKSPDSWFPSALSTGWYADC